MNAAQVPLVFVLLLTFVPSAAIAAGTQPDAELNVSQKKRFVEASRLMDADNAVAACPILEEIVLAAPQHLAARASLADCYARTGKYYSSSRLYTILEQQAAEQKQNTTRRMAIDRRAAIEQKISHVRIVVPDVLAQSKDLIVLHDGERVFPAQWGIATPVDRGTHTIEAQIPGESPWKKIVDVWQDSAIVVVTVDMPLPYRSEKKVNGSKSEKLQDFAEKGPVLPIPAPRKSWNTEQILGMTTAGLGAVGLGLGIAFGVAAVSKQNESNDGSCDKDNFCTPLGMRLRDETLAYGNASTGMFITGGIFAAGGTALFLLASRKTPKTREIGRPVVSFGPGNVFVHGQF